MGEGPCPGSHAEFQALPHRPGPSRVQPERAEPSAPWSCRHCAECTGDLWAVREPA